MFDVEADPNKRHDLSQSMPGMVQQLLARPTEVSKTGTQGAHLCRNASTEVSKTGTQGAHLPFDLCRNASTADDAVKQSVSGGQFDFVWLPAHAPHVGPRHVWCPAA